MLISIDYDNTFTKDPPFWRFVIKNAYLMGHQFICVTNRTFPNKETEKLEEIIPVLYAGAVYKQEYAKFSGYNVDVWIDDMPGTICKSVELP